MQKSNLNKNRRQKKHKPLKTGLSQNNNLTKSSP